MYATARSSTWTIITAPRRGVRRLRDGSHGRPRRAGLDAASLRRCRPIWDAYPRRCPVTSQLLAGANTKWILVPKAIDGVPVRWLNSHYLNVEPLIARTGNVPQSLPFSHHRFAERATIWEVRSHREAPAQGQRHDRRGPANIGRGRVPLGMRGGVSKLIMCPRMSPSQGYGGSVAGHDSSGVFPRG